MSKRANLPCNQLGVEAGFYVPARTLGDAVKPPPRSLRVAVMVVLALLSLSGGLVVYTVPVATHTWKVVSHQTDRVLGHILGRADLQTAKFLNELSGTDPQALETQTAINPVN
jgi:hypothetical protein